MAELDYMKAVEFDKLSASCKKRWGSVQAMVDAGFFVQPKFDGCFMKAIVHRDRSVTLSTRTGKAVRSCNHLKPALRRMSIKLGGGENTFYGEVWKPATPFPEISGLFRQHKPAEALGFMVNDWVGAHGLVYKHRLAALQAAEILDTNITTVPSGPAFSSGLGINTYAATLVDIGGYDGAIVRDPDAFYTPGLVKNGELVKVKPLTSLDLMVTGLYGAPGDKTGRAVYTIRVDYRGVSSLVGSGMPHSKAECPVPGDIVQVDCLGVTKDGKLREPRYISIRYDKEAPDV